ncbi:hypothetical protein BH11PSE11_BH11PSE11_11790 [soil metagenome]
MKFIRLLLNRLISNSPHDDSLRAGGEGAESSCQVLHGYAVFSNLSAPQEPRH